MGKSIGRISNWREYEQALLGRHSLEIFVDGALLDGWLDDSEPRGRGRRALYSDEAVASALSLAAMFGMALRSAEGLLRSILALAQIDLPVPDHTTLSRRAAKLGLPIGEALPTGASARVVLLDSTGLKIAGEGEWKVRVHGADSRRQWLKLHLAVDAASLQVVAFMATKSTAADAHAAVDLLDCLPSPPAVAIGDGAYDHIPLRREAASQGTVLMAPPPKNARLGRHPDRDAAVAADRAGGRGTWKKASGYHARSLVETGMGRLKGMLGGKLSAKKPSTLMAQIASMVRVLNLWTRMGMPKRTKVSELRK